MLAARTLRVTSRAARRTSLSVVRTARVPPSPYVPLKTLRLVPASTTVGTAGSRGIGSGRNPWLSGAADFSQFLCKFPPLLFLSLLLSCQ